MKIPRIALRLLLIGIHVVIGVLLCAFVLKLHGRRANPTWQREIVCWWLRTFARIVGIRVHLRGKPAEGVALVVANHVSWMDIVIVGAMQQVSFLAKIEISRWPVVGYLARRAGTLFINRGGGAEATTQLISERLRDGASIAFFPEGTTSDGTGIRRFHPRLFAAAVESGVPVQPIVITYPYKNANGVHPKAPYTNDMPFFTHVIKILGEPRIHAVAHYTDNLPPGNDNRSRVAAQARELMVAAHGARAGSHRT